MNHATAHTITLWCAIFAKLAKGVERRLSSSGLATLYFRVLLQMEGANAEGVSALRMARMLVARPSTVTAALEALAKRGLVEPCGAEDAPAYRLTEAGAAMRAETEPVVASFMDEVAASLEKGDRTLLAEMLYDAVAHPGGYYASCAAGLARGKRLPLACVITAMETFTQTVATTAKKSAELSLTEYRFLLELLPKRPGVTKRLRAKDVVALLRTKRSFVTTTAYKLEEAGLIVREPDPDDARGVLFGLTPLGELTVLRVGDDIAAVLEGMFGMRTKSPVRLMHLAKSLLGSVDRALEGGAA